MHFGEHPERFGLMPGDQVRTTKQYQGMGLGYSPPQYGWVIYFQQGSAWVQWIDGTRALLGCAWLEKYHGPMDGSITETTIDDILGPIHE